MGGLGRRAGGNPGATRSVARVYDTLAPVQALIFSDWAASVRRQGRALDRLIRTLLGPGRRDILDATCGIGTQAIGLAKRGHRVRGSDLSRAAVAQARREAARAGVRVPFAVADVRRLDRAVTGRFDVLLSCDNALPHLLTRADLVRALRAMGRACRPGGLVLASVRDYDAMAAERPPFALQAASGRGAARRLAFQIRDWAADGSRYTVHQFVLCGSAGRCRVTYAAAPYRAWRRAELAAACRAAGLRDVRWHLPRTTGYYQPIVTARPAGSGLR